MIPQGVQFILYTLNKIGLESHALYIDAESSSRANRQQTIKINLRQPHNHHHPEHAQCNILLARRITNPTSTSSS